MARSPRPTDRVAVLAVALALGCGGGGIAARDGGGWEDRYPEDVSPPEGTVYPCALTALPRELPGVPQQDRRFVNHVYADVLAATRAKLAFLRDADSPSGAATALERYLSEVGAARERIEAEPAPEGLEGFRSDVATALGLQIAAFREASDAEPGGVLEAVHAHPDALRASHLLRAAWATMSRRYPNAPRELRDSIFHHLCALDLF